MQTATSSPATTNAAGVVVQTAITAGGRYLNHVEGVIVQTTIAAGGRLLNHSESLVRSLRR